MRALVLLSTLPLTVLLACADKSDGLDDSAAPGTTDAAVSPDADADGFGADVDCDDTDPAIHPAAPELCDTLDNDCDGAIDEGVTTAWFRDADGDGHGAADDPGEAHCDDPSEGDLRFSATATDCDDTDASVHPDATEVCDPDLTDEDCNGWANDADPSLDIGSAATWIIDGDDDGFGDALDPGTRACIDPSTPSVHYTTDASDCDDTDASVHPDAVEACDGRDNDCDGDVDDADAELDDRTRTAWYTDADADGFGDAAAVRRACVAPSGTVADDTDCDDTDATVHPAATEVCDAGDVDEDCSGWADDDDPGVDAATTTLWVLDRDGDGYGTDDGTGTSACDDPSTASLAYVADTSDCDDTDAAISPAASEVCDGLDNDCDGTLDDADTSVDPASQTSWFTDADADGFGDAATEVLACEAPSGTVADDTDCDDTADTTHPGAEVLCGDATVNDCDLDLAEEAEVCAWSTTYARDHADAIATLDGEAFGAGLAVGDFDGDGLDEVAWGVMWTEDDSSTGGTEWGRGSVYVFDGSQHGDFDPETTTTELSGADDGDFLGSAVAAVPDLDGDGFDELLIGATNRSGTASSEGAAFLVMGPLTGGDAAAQATAEWSGSDEDDGLGALVAAAGDLDGDGTVDLLLGAPRADTGGSNGGSIYVVSSAQVGTIDVESSATVEIYGDSSWDTVGYKNTAVGGSDLDGDGLADLAVGAAYMDVDASSDGGVAVFYGPLTGTVDLYDADLLLHGAAEDAWLGAEVAAGFDFDLDGTDDLALGSPGEATGGTDAGAVYVLAELPESSGTIDGLADLTIYGAEGQLAGGAVDAADQDGDGTVDLLVGHGMLVHAGSSSSWRSGSDIGHAWLFLSPSSGAMGVGSATVSFHDPDTSLGDTVAFGGDLGGDGVLEVVLGDPDTVELDRAALLFFGGGGF